VSGQSIVRSRSDVCSILLDDEMRIKVTDFGGAKLLGPDVDSHCKSL
jgi:hypothetical protein